MASKHRFTIYDMMEEKGVFSLNPANADSRGPQGAVLYKGPQEYPRMFYHPEGKYEVTRVGETEMVHGQVRMSGEERQIICKLAENAVEAKELRTAGWHDHPARAIGAGGGIAPAMGSEQRISDLQKQIEELTRERDAGMEALRASAGAKIDPKAKPFKAPQPGLDLSALNPPAP